MQPVKSSYINRVKHEGGKMLVEFKDGSRYEYEVEEELFNKGLKEEDYSGWFRDNIRTRKGKRL